MIDKYNQAFQEDVREILLELESARLELNERRDDPKLVALMEPVQRFQLVEQLRSVDRFENVGITESLK